MELGDIVNEIKTLSPGGQRQVAKFNSFIKQRNNRSANEKPSGKINMPDEPFIGMWKDRKDLKD